MYSPGKYVRAPANEEFTDSSDDDLSLSRGKYVRVAESHDEHVVQGNLYSHYQTEIDPGNENMELRKRSATRDEAFQVDSLPLESTHLDSTMAMAITHAQSRDSVQRKRMAADEREFDSRRKLARSTGRNWEIPSTRRQERCSRCNRAAHSDRLCPALSRNCNACGLRGHFAATCRRRRVRIVEEHSGSSSQNNSNVQKINALSLRDVLISCRVGSSSAIEFLVDSGADVNVIGGDDWSTLEDQCRSCIADVESIDIPGKELHGYGADTPMFIERAFRAKIQAIGLEKPIVTADFLVVKEGRRSLLGRSTASDMELLKIGFEVNTCEKLKHMQIFPKMPGVKIKFSIDKTVPPEKNAYYNVPAAYREAARDRLKEMENRGIIEKVITAPEWISGMSAVPKGRNDFRLVVNMRAPNKAIKRQYFRLPVLEEMKVKLHGARYVSKFDLSSAYYHLELSSESRDLTTFLAENGMYRFTRLMFGVNCAPEIFQREISRILEGIENKIVYIDDILVFAETLEKLHSIVAKVLQILKANNLTLNLDKCEFDKTHITFIGHELDEKGINIEETKIEDIRKFHHPTSISELRSFLGLATFVSPHIAKFADISSPLWSVVSSKTWSWGKEQNEAFELLKDRIIRCTNQREALSAVWAVEHFGYYLLGGQFTLRTDAKGITFLLNRSRESTKRALTRADGWVLRLSPYRYDVEFVRGRDNLADPSSRLYDGNDNAFNEKSSPWEIAHLQANNVEFLIDEEIRQATSKDILFQRLIDSLESGDWPDELRRFKTISNDLSIENGIVNGLAENFMKVVNKAMCAATSSETSYLKELRDAVHAYNPGFHSVIKLPPEEIMKGRKVRRGLPLLKYRKSVIDEQLIDTRDREGKLEGKVREDRRRGAKPSAIGPGDTVIVERYQSKGKGESRFGTKKFTVLKEDNGNLLLTDEEGHITKRHVSQTRKVGQWRDNSGSKVDMPIEDNSSNRSKRVPKVPKYLSDYVQTLGGDKSK
ncbi:uncharacterized protein LOC129728846 [Wyeomyia smithii]|uniref:uncharacterized protein LOC129728846 n=1 Tax=Wyeomyia smithii TaxID=174621 RepID=UPI0024681460|nr:uncharacterized protein LOC129728846 [Wyeomyia smithii]